MKPQVYMPCMPNRGLGMTPSCIKKIPRNFHGEKLQSRIRKLENSWEFLGATIMLLYSSCSSSVTKQEGGSKLHQGLREKKGIPLSSTLLPSHRKAQLELSSRTSINHKLQLNHQVMNSMERNKEKEDGIDCQLQEGEEMGDDSSTKTWGGEVQELASHPRVKNGSEE